MTDSEKIDIIIQQIFKNEGGYSNIEGDRGGATNFGISKRYHPQEDIKNMTKERAKQIYLSDYVLPVYDTIASRDINYMYQVIDTAINMGVSRALKFHQVAQGDLQTYKQQRIDYYNKIASGKNAQFLRGWLKRVNVNF